MSEYVRHRGIIKRISTKETAKEVYEKLVADGEIDGKWTEFREDGSPSYIDSDKYDIINDCIFDISGAPTEYDTEEDVEEAVRLNDTDYRIHLYYYNGGASMSEVLDDVIPEADKAYKGSEDVEKELDDIMEDLIVGHNFDYARKALLEWHYKNRA